MKPSTRPRIALGAGMLAAGLVGGLVIGSSGVAATNQPAAVTTTTSPSMTPDTSMMADMSMMPRMDMDAMHASMHDGIGTCDHEQVPTSTVVPQDTSQRADHAAHHGTSGS